MALLHMLLDARQEHIPGPYALQPLETPQFPYPIQELPPDSLERYTGKYSYPDGTSIEVTLIDRRLVMDFGFGEFDLLPLSETEFVVVDSRERVSFSPQPDGAINLKYQPYDSNPMSALSALEPAVMPPRN
jgi:hypothetical protein